MHKHMPFRSSDVDAVGPSTSPVPHGFAAGDEGTFLQLPATITPEIVPELAGRMVHEGQLSPHHAAVPSGLQPIDVRLPGNLGGVTANVDQSTGNAIASAFLGGLLVALGAISWSMLGGKPRTA